VHQAAFLLGLFAFLSQLLGLIRDRLLAHFIGPSLTLDLYYAAFRIPDFIFVSVASLVSIAVLVPFLSETIQNSSVESKKDTEHFITTVFSGFFVILVGVCLVVYILMPYLVSVLFPVYTGESEKTLISLSRILLASPILLGLSNILGSVTQLFKRFFIYSMSPVLYNVGIIIGVAFLYPLFGVFGLVYGVVCGALFHFLIQFFATAGIHFLPKITYTIDWKLIIRVVKVSIPRTVGLMANNIAMTILIALASFLPEGAISIFVLAYGIQSVPLSIIGLSYSVAAFPVLAELHVKEDKKAFMMQIENAARQIIFWSFPIIALFIVLRAQIVRVILGGRSFSWDATRLTAAALALFAISVVAQSLIALLVRGYYATGKTMRPLLVNVSTSVGIVLLAFIIPPLLSDPSTASSVGNFLRVSTVPDIRILGLVLAYTLGTILNFIILLFFFKKDFNDVRYQLSIGRTSLESIGASIVIGIVAYSILGIVAKFLIIDTFFGIFFQGAIAGCVGILAGIIVLYICKSRELSTVSQTLKSKFWKTADTTISATQEDLQT
jgi:putative peptidoglycan lipid II flippase